jgi:hypothetical protein
MISQINALKTLIRKGKKNSSPTNLLEYLQRGLSEIYSESISRDVYFLCLYYGLIKHPSSNEALTLEAIGLTHEPPLSRERVRQIIDNTIKKIQKFFVEESNLDKKFYNPYKHTNKVFQQILANDNIMFLRVEKFTKNEFYKDFHNNIKGLIAFCNDCGIKQIAYRKKYYLYPKHISRSSITDIIQKSNKIIRREETLDKMNLKAKTVTYVPTEVREHLHKFAKENNYNLNPLYEKILLDFISQKPYANDKKFYFSKTQSWKARMGKAKWQQIGIYIKKDVFLNVQKSAEEAQNYMVRKVSVMSFVCQAFIWHYEQFNPPLK